MAAEYRLIVDNDDRRTLLVMFEESVTKLGDTYRSKGEQRWSSVRDLRVELRGDTVSLFLAGPDSTTNRLIAVLEVDPPGSVVEIDRDATNPVSRAPAASAPTLHPRPPVHTICTILCTIREFRRSQKEAKPFVLNGLEHCEEL